ncbi:MAG: hypothetical protein Kow0010_23490 [Dehalococcoidia bacterium]
MRYFAYGSNMDPEQMAERCPGAVPFGPARLDGWRLTFDRFSTRRRGYVADVVPAPSAATWGVLWEVTAAHLEALDRSEGVANGAYRRAELKVRANDGSLVDAVAYTVCEPGPPGPPSPAYLGHLLRGAHAAGMPAWYIRFLEGFATSPGEAR